MDPAIHRPTLEDSLLPQEPPTAAGATGHAPSLLSRICAAICRAFGCLANLFRSSPQQALPEVTQLEPPRDTLFMDNREAEGIKPILKKAPPTPSPALYDLDEEFVASSYEQTPRSHSPKRTSQAPQRNVRFGEHAKLRTVEVQEVGFFRRLRGKKPTVQIRDSNAPVVDRHTKPTTNRNKITYSGRIPKPDEGDWYTEEQIDIITKEQQAAIRERKIGKVNEQIEALKYHMTIGTIGDDQYRTKLATLQAKLATIRQHPTENRPSLTPRSPGRTPLTALPINPQGQPTVENLADLSTIF